MKRPCTALATLLLPLAAALLPLCASADARAWRADLASEEVHNEYVRRGDSATLRVAVYLRGRVYRPTTAVARYRAGLDSSDWLQAPCSIASNVVEVAWTPLLAPGADVVPMIVHVDGEVYRIPLMLYVRDSPGGDEPGERPVLDFGAYALTNAPWALPSDIPAPPVLSVNGKTGEVALAASDVGAATVADATLTDTTTFSEWTISPAGKFTEVLWGDEYGVFEWMFSFDDYPLQTGNHDPNATSVSAVDFNDGITYTASRTAIHGYQLGSQSDKPLAAATHTHTADEISGPTPRTTPPRTSPSSPPARPSPRRPETTRPSPTWRRRRCSPPSSPVWCRSTSSLLRLRGAPPIRACRATPRFATAS